MLLAAVRLMMDEVTGLRFLMTLWRLWRDVQSHLLVSYRTCFVNILKVGSIYSVYSSTLGVTLSIMCIAVHS